MRPRARTIGRVLPPLPYPARPTNHSAACREYAEGTPLVGRGCLGLVDQRPGAWYRKTRARNLGLMENNPTSLVLVDKAPHPETDPNPGEFSDSKKSILSAGKSFSLGFQSERALSSFRGSAAPATLEPFTTIACTTPNSLLSLRVCPRRSKDFFTSGAKPISTFR
jgi:hypothetical protein